MALPGDELEDETEAVEEDEACRSLQRLLLLDGVDARSCLYFT